MQRLLSVAGERRVSYLMAVYTGLRSGELGALKWADLHLNVVTPIVRVRANTTKNGKSADMRLHPDLATELREHASMGVEAEDLVFKTIPRIDRFRRDLIKAGIAPVDERLFFILCGIRSAPTCRAVAWPAPADGQGLHRRKPPWHCGRD